MIISELVVSMDVVEVKCAVKSVAGRNDSRVKQNRASLSVRTYNLENWAKVLTISQSGQPHQLILQPASMGARFCFGKKPWN